MYKELTIKVVNLEDKITNMLIELHKAIDKDNKSAMRRFRKLSGEITKELKDLRKESINIEKESK
jgi:Na+/phosphate symporter